MKTDESNIQQHITITYNNGNSTKEFTDNAEYLKFLRRAMFIEPEYNRFIAERNMKEKSLKDCEIDWNTIMGIFDDKFLKLWNKIAVPNSVDEYNFIKELYKDSVFDLIKEKMFMSVYYLASYYTPASSVAKTRKGAIKIVRDDLDEFLPPIYRMLELIKISLEEDPETITKFVSESSVIIKKIKQGEKFRGKKNRGYEVEIYKTIIKKYDELKSDGYSVSYRSLAFNYARKELELIHENEQQRFYDRFKNYKNKRK